MAASEPALYREMLAGMAAPDSADGMRAETQIFKAAHPQIGAYLIGLWGFSDDIVQAVAHHHTPGEGTSERADLLAIVHAAEAFSTFSDPVAALSALDADYFRALGIDGKPEEWLAAVNLLAA
jgi:HD-like signal output (HDOD) protein